MLIDKSFYRGMDQFRPIIYLGQNNQDQYYMVRMEGNYMEESFGDGWERSQNLSEYIKDANK